MNKLTARFVETKKEPGKYYDLHGLFLRIYSSGSKNWVQRLTIKGKRHDLGLGNANVKSLAQARSEAFNNLRDCKEGRNPLRERQQQNKILTFKEAALEVIEINRPNWSNEKHAAQWRATFTKYAFPLIGDLKVDEIDTTHMLDVLKPIWLEKAVTASRVRQRMSAVFTWSIAKRWRTDNPADSVASALPKQSSKVKPRKSLDYREVQNFIQTVQNSDTMMSIKLALEFTILTATRPSEAREAKWSEIKESTWIVPSERMKERVEHRVPLSSRCLEILAEAKTISDGSDYIFLGGKAGRAVTETAVRKALKRSDFDLHVHGFRTSFRTWTQEKTNYAREVAEMALAHKLKDKAEAAYARSDLFEQRKSLMEDWARYVSTDEAKIISLRG